MSTANGTYIAVPALAPGPGTQIPGVGTYIAVPSLVPGASTPIPTAGTSLSFVAYLYRASDGSHGSAPAPAQVPAGAVIERVKAGI